MKKKFLSFLAIGLTIAVTASGCGVSVSKEDSASSGGGAAQTESAAPAAESEAASSDAPAASSGEGIKLFNGKIEIATALNHAAEVYEAATGKHVEVESLGGGVDLQATLKQYYQAGNMPDIFIGEGATDFNNWTGMMEDLAGEEWASRTEAEFVDADGVTIGYPYTTEAIGLAYNKDILDKAGIDVASLTGPDKLREAFETIDAKKDELGITAVVGYCAEASALYWSSAQHVFGQYIDAGLARNDTTYIDLLNDGGKYDTERFTNFAKMVGMLNEFSDPALLVSGTYDQQVQNFASGKYAFVTQGSWIGASMTDAYKSDYEAAGSFACGFTPYAFEDGIDTILTNSPSWWAVYKDGKVDEAKEFLQWLSEADGQKIMVEEAGCVSPYTDCTTIANDPFAQTIADYTAAGKTSSWHWLDQPGNLAQDYTGILFQDYASGNLKTAEDFVNAMVQVTPQCYQ